MALAIAGGTAGNQRVWSKPAVCSVNEDRFQLGNDVVGRTAKVCCRFNQQALNRVVGRDYPPHDIDQISQILVYEWIRRIEIRWLELAWGAACRPDACFSGDFASLQLSLGPFVIEPKDVPKERCNRLNAFLLPDLVCARRLRRSQLQLHVEPGFEVLCPPINILIDSAVDEIRVETLQVWWRCILARHALVPQGQRIGNQRIDGRPGSGTGRSCRIRF